MIKSVIIDDKESYREKLREIIENEFSDKVQVLAEADDISTGLEIILRHQPGLVFLDIEMPGGTGFDLLEKLGAFKFDVIFMTVHQDYALRAIKFSALDYLIKPVDPDELKKAIQKHEAKKNQLEAGRQFEVLFQNLKNINSPDNQIGLPCLNGLMFVVLKDIIRCKSDSNYTDIFMKDKTKFTVSRTLGEVEKLLADNYFMRIHDSNIINLRHLRKYIKGDGGIAIMSDGSEIDVSRRKKDEFKQRLADLKMVFN